MDNIQLGQYGGSCKEWARANTLASYGVTIPSTDVTQYKWVNESTPATKVAQWLSYVNGRLGPISLSYNMSSSTTVYVPNGDLQTIVIYASTGYVSATITKTGSTTLSVTSMGLKSGTIASGTTVGAGTWTLTVRNNGGAVASGIVAVVLSQSRFQSDWQTARRGDIIQMFGGNSDNRGLGIPHTTFVQTNSNSNGGADCSGSVTTGCNWLDSNWVAANTVGAHNFSMAEMIKRMAYSSSYGFTVYRLN